MKHYSRVRKVLAGTAALGLLSTATAFGGSYLVLTGGNGLPAGLERGVTQAGGTVTRALPQVGIAVVESAKADFKAKVAKIAGVQAVLPNLTVQWLQPVTAVEGPVAETGNPPFSGDDDFFFDLQWGHTAIEAPAAWDLGSRGAGATVAVLDTGFDLDHPDLAPNIDFARSMNFVAGETLWYARPDPFSHGSHTAGTIAAADNAFGTIGVAPEATLMLVKVLGDQGGGSFGDVISGILWAADQGANVINMSLGATLWKNGFIVNGEVVTAREVNELKNALARATTYAYQKGVTVIASAGNAANDGDHDKALIHLPSDCPNVISVSATAPIGWATDPLNTFLDNLASYSNYGQSVITVAAPGGDFIYPGNELCMVAGLVRPCWVFDLVFSTGSSLNPAVARYYWSAGTSMAAPHASGVAALIVGKYGPGIKPAQVEALLRKSADDLGKPGQDDAYGAGRVNAYNAVR
jgi:subtilisin family serine protease